MPLKDLLGKVPYSAELYELLRPGRPRTRYNLSQLEQALPAAVEQARPFAEKAPRGRRIVLLATLHYWVEQAAIIGLTLRGLGHDVTIAYLPYGDWRKEVSAFDLRRQDLYTRRVLALLKGLVRVVSLLEVVMESKERKSKWLAMAFGIALLFGFLPFTLMAGAIPRPIAVVQSGTDPVALPRENPFARWGIAAPGRTRNSLPICRPLIFVSISGTSAGAASPPPVGCARSVMAVDPLQETTPPYLPRRGRSLSASANADHPASASGFQCTVRCDPRWPCAPRSDLTAGGWPRGSSAPRSRPASPGRSTGTSSWD